jgi:hypothetical protein
MSGFLAFLLFSAVLAVGGFFLKKKEADSTPMKRSQEAFKQVGHMWDSSDVEKRAKLLGNIEGLEDDRMFLAIVHAPWAQLPESTRIKLFELWCRRDVESHRVEIAAKGIGQVIATMRFSEAHFDSSFGAQEHNENWSRERALGIWYGLGKICLLVSLGNLQRLKREYYETADNVGTSVLLSNWKMSDATREHYERFVNHRLPLFLQMYLKVDSKEQLTLFFDVIVSEMMGQEATISADDFAQGLLALLLKGWRVNPHPIAAVSVSSWFCEVVGAVKEYDKLLPVV